MVLDHINKQVDLFHNEEGYAKNKIKKKNIDGYKFIDLFAGIGGFRLGFQRKFSKCVFTSEWDKFAAQTYESNFNEVPFGDINKLDLSQLDDFQILLGGFPCQPFSKIGLRQGFKHKTQGNLFYNIVEVLKIKKPVSFVLENVTGLLHHKSEGEHTIEIMGKVLEELGYEVNLGLLNAADYGVPQNRRRLFFVGFLKDKFNEPTCFKFPKPKRKKNSIKNILERDVKGYSISKRLQKSYIYKDNKFPEIVDYDSEIIVKTLVSTYHKIQRLTGTFVKDGETGLRLLSKNECKKLMGFPDNFKIPVSRTQMYRQFGNAVVVPVVSAIAEEVYKVLSSTFVVGSGK
jgi:DNA (cytosine-5)-methyltransferase 1